MKSDVFGRRSIVHVLKSLVFVVILLSLFLYGLVPIHDFDFWWHIETGKYILEHRALPDKDPFTYTFLERDPDMPDWAPVVLKSFWLSQIIFYIIYHSAGPLGINLFRSFIFALILFLLWKYLRENSVSPVLSSIMLSAFVLFSKEFMAPRPQIFSFLFTMLLLYMLERTRNAYRGSQGPARYSLYGIPLVMVLWANMHRGYPVGMAFIAVYILGLLYERLFSGRNRSTDAGITGLPRRMRVFVVSIFVTMLNPVTYRPVTSLIAFQGSMLQRETMEFSPLPGVWRHLNADWYPLFVLLLMSLIVIGMHIASLIRGKTKTASVLPAEHILLLAGTALASLSSLRYGMFFMLAAIPIVTAYLCRRFQPGVPAVFRRAGIAVLAVMLLILFFGSPLFDKSRAIRPDGPSLPVRAAEFIKEKSLPANIFNDIAWGGYLMWELYPEYRMFSDTRTLNLEIYRQYLSILNANERMFFGVPEWKALIDMYSVSTIVHGAVNPYSGEVYPLMLKLLMDDTWHLVYADGTAAILVRKMPHGLMEYPKERLLEEIRREVLRGLERSPGHPGFLRTLSMLGQTR